MEVLPVGEDKDMLGFLMVATETGHTETGMTCVWKIMMTCFPLLGNLTGVPLFMTFEGPLGPAL